MWLGQAFRRIFRERCSDRRLPGTRGSDKHSVRYFDNGARVEGHRGAFAYVSACLSTVHNYFLKGYCALARVCKKPTDERPPGIGPPHAVARVNLCVLWVGCQLSLLGGKWPIATTRCDRRRATIDSCALREAINSPGPHARSPPSQVARLRADVRATPVDNPGLKH